MNLKNKFLIAAALFAFASCNNAPKKTSVADAVDAIYYGGDIITMEGDSANCAEAVAIKNGKIVFVGSKADAEKLHGDSTVMNDLKGKTLMPGFIDPHVHPSIAAGILPLNILSAMEWVTPNGVTTPITTHDDYIKALKKLDESMPDKNEVLIVWGYHPAYHGTIAKKELNEISLTRPIVLWHRSCHDIWLNDKALEHYKISKDDFKKGGAFADFKTGHCFESGMFSVYAPVINALGNPTQFAKGLKLMSEVIHKGGLTTIGEQGFPQIDLGLETKLDGEEFNKASTPFRYYKVANAMYFLPRQKTAERTFEFVDSLIKNSPADQRYEKAIKYYADGAIFSAAMKLKEPFLDGHNGVWMMTPEEQEAIFKKFYDAGWDIHIHVNGDAGVDQIIKTLDDVCKGKIKDGVRIVLEHYGYARDDQHKRLGEYGVAISCNPYYLYELGPVYLDSLTGMGAIRASLISSCGSVLKNKMRLSFHSDYFMAPAEPLKLVWVAVNRVASNGMVMGAEEKIPVYDALKAVTIEAAYSLRLEEKIGSIAIGKNADFTILKENPLKLNPIKIKDIKITETVLEGKSFPL